MIVKHRVASFDNWKAIFDEMEASRRRETLRRRQPIR